ncbi:cellulose-binding domain-containing protein [Paractinoplanes ferrugineus]|uniref:Hydrolase n=1 Tax=Paractinoplanes ferrugineus TaxID=113564 RepID=A0A919MHX5_9ACTN|nr:cellulose-binding domain-containing protein [Actinoplanes ferrugineus]GIE15409.1 hydrolase [Actinoplanes ferrugineus]
MRRRGIALAVAGSVASAGLIVAAASTASAATACAVVYTANSWSGGFTADVKVVNNGSPVSSWTVAWSFGGNQKVTSAWNASVTQSGTAVTATNVAWNGNLGTGASASFGFQGTFTGSNPIPIAFTLNGVACGDQPTPPPTTPATTAPTTPPTTTPTTPPTTGPTTPPTTPPTSTPPQNCGTAAACEGFEAQTGTAPSGNWSISTPDCSGAGTATIDRTTAHSGSTSLKINGAEGYCNHVFAKNTAIFGTTSTVRYVRYWVRHTTALPASHVTTVAMTDSRDGNKDLRFGGQNGALQFNRASDDATLPEQSPAGVALSTPLPTNTWNCVEFKVDGGNGTIETWLNGTSVPGLLEDGTPTHDIDSQWLNKTWRPALTDLKLGWESYGQGTDTLWYDDVAVSATRNGC